MPKLTLKNILGKNSEATAIILSLIDELQAKIWVEDDSGKILLNAKLNDDKFQFPVPFGK